jgi:hypothetical protein
VDYCLRLFEDPGIKVEPSVFQKNRYQVRKHRIARQRRDFSEFLKMENTDTDLVQITYHLNPQHSRDLVRESGSEI